MAGVKGLQKLGFQGNWEGGILSSLMIVFQVLEKDIPGGRRRGTYLAFKEIYIHLEEIEEEFILNSFL